MPPSFPSSTFTSRRYALVIDAGSSGSRMQIYSWKDARAEREEVRAASSSSSSSFSSDSKGKAREQDDIRQLRRLPRVERGVKEGSGDWQKKVEPGISTLALAPISQSAVSSYLSPLLAHAKATIPPSLHSSTPVYILATAGMRLLPSETSDALIQASCDVLRQEFPFRVESEGPEGPCGGSVRVISGEEEGLWGWVAVNYLMDGFGDPDALEPTAPSDDDAEDDPFFATSSSSSTTAPSTYGFLDMGGASTQIAFSPSPAEAASHASSLSSVKLRLLSGEDMDFSVFVASWLGYGTNKARERYVGLKVEEWETSLRPSGTTIEPSIPDPCLPKSLVLSELPKIPHSHLATASSSSANHLLSTHSLVGTGSFPECLKSLQPLLNKHLPCPSPHECLFDGLPTPKIDFDQQRFIGVSEYWYSSEHVFNMGGAWDFLEFERKAGEFCAREWGEIELGYERSRKFGESPHSGDGEVLDADGRVVEMGKWGAEVEIPRLQMQCFKAAWLVNVLHEGIGLPRIVDPGGGRLSSSSSSPLSKIEREAARKAKQKGLGGPSFQSIDTVGDTAISWTLGKMVIEASRDVPAALPSSSYVDWVSLPDRLLGIDELMQGRLDRLGGGSYFAYGFVLLAVIFLFFVKFRRRVFRVASPVRRVNRWKKDLEESDEYEEEESFVGGNGNGGPSLRPRSPNRFLKSWLSAVSFGIRRIIRHSPASTFLSSDLPSTLKHTRSSPAIPTSSNAPIRRSASAFFAASTGYYPSPPSSPRKKGFRPPSIDATKAQADSNGLGIDVGGGGSAPETATMHSSTPTPFSPKSTTQLAGGGATTNSGPPRASRRPSPQSGAGSVDFHLLPLTDILGKALPSSLYSIAQGGSASSGTGSGWNDPPNDIFNGNGRPSGTIEEGFMSGTLTPPASHAITNGGGGGGMSSSSRNSSRVDLSGLAGLTGRSISRNGASAGSSSRGGGGSGEEK